MSIFKLLIFEFDEIQNIFDRLFDFYIDISIFTSSNWSKRNFQFILRHVLNLKAIYCIKVVWLFEQERLQI